MSDISGRSMALRILLAGLALGLILVPGEAWARPDADYQQDGFDPNLHYVDVTARSLFDPFLALDAATWQPCPCAPGSLVAIRGSGLAVEAEQDDFGALTLAGTRVLVNGRQARLHLVTPSQVTLALPEEARPGVARVALLSPGRPPRTDTVAIGDADSDRRDAVRLTAGELGMQIADGREPAVHLLTTPLSFRAGFTATISSQLGDAVPLRVSFWSPRNYASFDLVFAGERRVQAVLSESPGKITRTYDLAGYAPGDTLEVTVEWRRNRSLAFFIEGPSARREVRLQPGEAPSLFEAYRPSLTVLGSAHRGSASSTLRGYHLTLLPGRFTTVRTGDSRLPLLMLALALASAAALVGAGLRRGIPALRGLRPRARAGAPFIVAGLAFAGLNALIIGLGSHPFDMGGQRVWAYTAARYGLADLYYVAQTAPLAGVWRGMPYHEAVFPYNLGMAYYFGSIGHVHRLIFGAAGPDAASLEITIKAFNLAFLLADAALVYAIVRVLRPDSPAAARASAALIAFSPALLAGTSLWGETDSVALFFPLAASLAAVKRRPTLAWSLLAGAFLTKQTVLVAVPVIGLFCLLRFRWRQNLEGISSAILLASIASLPFTLSGYPPSIIIDPTLAAISVHGGAGAEKAFQIFSYDAFNLWTLVAWAAEGAQGAWRFHWPDYATAFAGISYQQAGLALFATLSAAAVLWSLLRARRFRASPQLLFVLLAFVLLAQVFLPSRTLSRYFVFPMVFSLLAVSGRGGRLAVFAFAALSITSFAGISGSMAASLERFPEHAPALAPDRNPLAAAALHLFRSDTFLTLAALLNALALLALAAALLTGLPATRRAARAVPVLQPAVTAVATRIPTPELQSRAPLRGAHGPQLAPAGGSPLLSDTSWPEQDLLRRLHKRR